MQPLLTQKVNKMTNYVQDAMRTMSDNWHGVSIAKSDFLAALNESIEALQKLDKIKKALFYGRNIELFEPQAETLQTTLQPHQLIHGIVGIATEAGELLENLKTAIEENEQLDWVNLSEECGDVFWYIAAISDFTGFDFESMQKTNIEKLKTRFPEKFSEEKANNRNTTLERKILEENV